MHQKYLQHIVLGTALGFVFIGISNFVPDFLARYVWDFDDYIRIEALVAPDVKATDTFQTVKILRVVLRNRAYPLVSNKTLSEVTLKDDNGNIIERVDVFSQTNESIFEPNSQNIANIKIALPILEKGEYVWTFCWEIDVRDGIEPKSKCMDSNVFKVL